MKTPKDNSRQQSDGRLHEHPQTTQQQRHEQLTLHAKQIQESQEQQSQETQTQSQKKWPEKTKSLNKPASRLQTSQSSPCQAGLTQFISRQANSAEMDSGSYMLEVETRPDGEERVYSKNGLIGATGHEMSRLYPSLSDYQATEAGQQYSYEELAVVMTPDRIERRMRLRQELRDSLRGIPIPPQAEVETARVAHEASAGRFENDQGIYSNVPLSFVVANNISMRKIRQSTGTNPEDLRRLEECLPEINSSLDRAPRYHRRRKILLSQGTQTEGSDIGREHEQTKLETATSPSELHHGQKDAILKSTDVGGTEDEKERLARSARHSTRFLPQCHDCEQNVTGQSSHGCTKRPKRLAHRLPTPAPEEPSIRQRQQIIEGRPKKKRNIRVIPGRFTALDSSDEEEDQEEYDRKQAQRRLKRIKLYNPRIDEVMEWTHDSSWKHTSLDTWRCPECEQRTRKTEQSCTFCSASRPGPPILNTISIRKLQEMEQEVKNVEKSSSLNVVDANTCDAASVSGSTGLISIPMTPIFAPLTTTALPTPFANAVSGGSSVSSSQLAPVTTTTVPMTTAALLPSSASSASGGSFIGAQLAPAVVTTMSMKTSTVGTLGPVPSSSTGIHVVPGATLTPLSSVTSPNTFNVTAVPLATIEATTAASFNFGLTSSSLQNPQLVQRVFQFGGFNAPSPFTFSAPALPTRVCAKTLSMPSSVLGPVVPETTTASPMTSMSAAPLSFNPFAAASAAVLGPFAAPSSTNLATSVSDSMAAGPTYEITINSFTTAPTIVSPAPALNLKTQFTQPESSSGPLRSLITPNVTATDVGSSMFAFHNPSTPSVPQPLVLPSTRTAPNRHNVFSALTPSVATAISPAPRPLGGLGRSGAVGFGSTSSTANANFTFGQQTTITPTPTPSSVGVGASTQTSNMISGSTGGLFGNGFAPSANRWTSTTFATTSISGHSGFGSTLTAPPGNLLANGYGFGASAISGVHGPMELLGALAGASVGIATGSGFGASNATSSGSGMATGSGLNGSINFTIEPRIPSTSAYTNPSQPSQSRLPYDRRNSKRRK